VGWGGVMELLLNKFRVYMISLYMTICQDGLIFSIAKFFSYSV